MAQGMTDAQKVGLVRNALLVAGHEMGETGDHWPVIKDTLDKIAKGWEQVCIEDNVDAQLKIHLYEQLEIMERGLDACSPEVRADVEPTLKELREIYDAYFCSVEDNIVPVREEEIPEYLKRADYIISTLEDDHVE